MTAGKTDANGCAVFPDETGDVSHLSSPVHIDRRA